MRTVGIFGVPRSGTSWLAHIFNSHPDVVLRFQPLFSYGHKGMLRNDSSGDEIRAFFDAILHSTDEFTLMKAEMQKDYPIFEKSPTPTHLVFKETRYLGIVDSLIRKSPTTKVVAIVRNPLAVLASWVRAPREFEKGWDIRREWREAPSKNRGRPEEFYGFNRWKEFAVACLRLQAEFPERLFLLRYADLNAAPMDKARQALDFCDLDMGEQTQDFIEDSRSRHDADPYSVFRSMAGDEGWRNVLPEEIADSVVDEIEGTELGRFLNVGNE